MSNIAHVHSKILAPGPNFPIISPTVETHIRILSPRLGDSLSKGGTGYWRGGWCVGHRNSSGYGVGSTIYGVLHGSRVMTEVRCNL